MQLLDDSGIIPEFCMKPILVLGCGNILFGDDGFGPTVVEMLEKRYGDRIPAHVCLLDAGTGVRGMLFTIALSERKPGRIIIVDAVDAGRRPGEVFDLPIEDLPTAKIDDFSLHMLPTSNLLRELRDLCGVDVRIVSCQVGTIPEEVSPGLSEALREALPRACEAILGDITGGST